MPASGPTPAAVLASLLRADPAGPRVTCYDDRAAERVELSGKTLATWVAKAATLLEEQADAGPGVRVGLDLPAHWRALYWAWAVWSVGATLVTGTQADGADVLVTTDPRRAAAAAASGRYAVLVTLAALARGNPETGPGVCDEARELAAFPDRHVPLATAGPGDPAWCTDAGEAAYGTVVRVGRHPAGTRAVVPDELDALVRAALDVWAVGGSIVLSRHARGDQAQRLAAERVTLDLR